MRILVYPHDLDMGGSQLNAIEMASAVSRLGHECIVFGRRGSLCARIDELGLEFIESPEPRHRPSLRIVRALRSIARERDIDVIHGYEWPPGMEAMMAAESLPGVAAVCTVMSMSVAPFLPRWLPLVVGTQQISAREQRAGRLDVHLIEPPVDLEQNYDLGEAAADRFRHGLRLDRRPVVVVVSRLVHDLKSEGILTAIDVATSLAHEAPFQLVIVGDGAARPEVELAAKQANHQLGRTTVTLTGELRDPRPAYNAADIVLGMGGSALRSLAFGKPLVVQGEGGYFRTLAPDSVDEFRWQGWFGVGRDSKSGQAALESELVPLIMDAQRRRSLGEFGHHVVQSFSLERAARRQVTIYRDAASTRTRQKGLVGDAGRSAAGLVVYHLRQRLARWRGTQRTDDFNTNLPTDAGPASIRQPATPPNDGPILYFPGVGWDATAGTDRHLATALAPHHPIIWVDTPHSILRHIGRGPAAVTHPQPNVVRLRASTLAGVQRPLLRGVANRRRAQVARRYLADQGLKPRVVLASTSAPMLALTHKIRAPHVYYATDDFVPAAPLWGVSARYLARAREANLAVADLVLAVSPELARHLQRSVVAPVVLPNGADLDGIGDIENVASANGIRLPGLLAGVVGQFNERTDVELLRHLPEAGIGLVLVGPASFRSDHLRTAFAALTEHQHVQWVGSVSTDAVKGYLRAIRVGITPYADTAFNRRSFPLKTVEYLAAGLPVVSTTAPPLDSFDKRFVVGVETGDELVSAVTDFLVNEPDRDEIRRSVRYDGWSARASDLGDLLEGTPAHANSR